MLMKTSHHAEKFFAQGYLCSQSILMAYAPLFNLERETAARLAAPFGGGVARRGETCGAVNGACMVLGLKYGHISAEDIESKERTYQAVHDFIFRFEDRHGSIVCSRLLEIDISSPDGLQQAHYEDLFTTRCPGYVKHAAYLLDELLSE
jgi:C_GCAxxG_C_C family probable redox protein